MLNKRMFALGLATIMIATALVTPTNVFATEKDDKLYDAGFYDSEYVTYIEEFPEELFSNYKNIIEEVDMFILENYGSDYVLSTSKNFNFDEYYSTIKLGVLLDIEDGELKEKIKKFADELDSIYIAPVSDEDFMDEDPTIEVDESNDIDNSTLPCLDASTYNVSAAVDYAREWTEEGKKLNNPNYKRYSNDCTNFVSQVLKEGGIQEVEGKRKEDSSWYYAWGIIARPSYTWGGAHNLYQHLKNHSENIKQIKYTSDLQVGDIISFDLNDDDKFHIGHTVVITEKNGNRWEDILVTYHTTDREDYPASNLIKAGYIPYGWHIN